MALYLKSNSKCVVMGVAFGKTADMPNPTQKCAAQRLFATNMRRVRKEKKLTQERVAEDADLHPNYISSVERGERNISICNIEKIAKALRVTMAELLTEPPTPTPEVKEVPRDAVS